MLSLLEGSWTKIKIAFDVQDPLQPTNKSFELPEDFKERGMHERRRLTICNLFANQNQTVEQIAYYLELRKGEVVGALIGEGLIKEQRSRPSRLIKGGRRDTDCPAEKAAYSLASPCER